MASHSSVYWHNRHGSPSTANLLDRHVFAGLVRTLLRTTDIHWRHKPQTKVWQRATPSRGFEVSITFIVQLMTSPRHGRGKVLQRNFQQGRRMHVCDVKEYCDEPTIGQHHFVVAWQPTRSLQGHEAVWRMTVASLRSKVAILIQTLVSNVLW